MRLLKPVQRKLVLHAAAIFHAGTYGFGQMKGVPHDAEARPVRFEQRKQIPKSRMQNGIAARQINIGDPAQRAAQSLYLRIGTEHFFPRHRRYAGMSLRKNIAMLAALVAVIGYMPLDRKI